MKPEDATTQRGAGRTCSDGASWDAAWRAGVERRLAEPNTSILLQLPNLGCALTNSACASCSHNPSQKIPVCAFHMHARSPLRPTG